MENKSNHSATAPNATPITHQNVNVSQSATNNPVATPLDNSLSASAVPAAMPVQSIDILKETAEKADITKLSEDKVSKVSSVTPSGIPILSSVINQKHNMVSEEQVELLPPTPTIVAQSIDSGFILDITDKLPSMQTVYPSQTVQQQKSSTAQFTAELTMKESASAAHKIDEAPQELSFRRTTSSFTPSNNNNNNSNNPTFDGFAGKMNKLRDQMSNIFPAGIMGCRDNTVDLNTDTNTSESTSNSRRFMDAKEASQDCVGHIDSTPRKRPSSCKPSTGRNPLTGFGLDETDDLKRGYGRKKDGNPVLGVGYGKDNDDAKPTGRIPPGGHSTKLW